LFATALVLTLSVGCGKKKNAVQSGTADDEEELACEANSDCEAGWICLDGECANSASGAVYTDPAHSVTPDKVKREVNKISENAQKRADKILDGL